MKSNVFNFSFLVVHSHLELWVLEHCGAAPEIRAMTTVAKRAFIILLNRMKKDDFQFLSSDYLYCPGDRKYEHSREAKHTDESVAKSAKKHTFPEM